MLSVWLSAQRPAPLIEIGARMTVQIRVDNVNALIYHATSAPVSFTTRLMKWFQLVEQNFM